MTYIMKTPTGLTVQLEGQTFTALTDSPAAVALAADLTAAARPVEGLNYGAMIEHDMAQMAQTLFGLNVVSHTPPPELEGVEGEDYVH